MSSEGRGHDPGAAVPPKKLWPKQHTQTQAGAQGECVYVCVGVH